METFCENSILPLDFTRWTSKSFFIFSNLLLQNLIHVRSHFNFLQSFNFAFENSCIFLISLSFKRFSLQSRSFLGNSLLNFFNLAENLCNFKIFGRAKVKDEILFFNILTSFVFLFILKQFSL